MRKSLFKNSLLISILSTFVVLTLLSSFGLHSIQISHSHPGHQEHHGDNRNHEHSGSTQQEDANHAGGSLTLGEYMHSAEKKLLFVLVSTLLMSSGMAAILYGNWSQFLLHKNLLLRTFFKRRKEIIKSNFNYLEALFCKGIVHPKLH